MIHWSNVVYLIVSTILAVLFIIDFVKETDGGNVWSGKSRNSIGFLGAFWILLLIIFTLIWGGIFWW